MPSSLVYVQPMTATLSTSCSHLPPSPSHSPKFSSHDSSFYTISLIHDTQFHLLLYSIALLFNLSILIASTWILTESLPSYYIWRRGMWITWLTSETTMSQRICCTYIIGYFIYDILTQLLFTRRDMRWMILHHIMMMMSCGIPIIWNVDGGLALIGFVLGEIHHPIHLLHDISKTLQIAHATQKRHDTSSDDEHDGEIIHHAWFTSLCHTNYLMCSELERLCTSSCVDLSVLHFLLFLVSRFMCLHFTAHALFPYAHSFIMKMCWTGIIILTFITLLAMAFQSRWMMRERSISRTYGRRKRTSH